MKVDSDTLIAEFHKKMTEEFPDISLEQAKQICHGPWKFLKEEMESGELNEIRFKYFGTFQVYPNRAKNMLDKWKERFRYNKIDKTQYFKIKAMLEKFINKKDEN